VLPESVDDGQLLEAVSQWLRARIHEDVVQLERLTISLPVQYQQVNREWLESEVAQNKIYAAAPVIADVDPSNPLHVTVLAEVAIRLQGACIVTSIASEWIRLGAKWRMLPGGVYLR
jgi:hypothetical protein